MKKLFAILVTLVIIVSLCGCNKKEAESGEPEVAAAGQTLADYAENYTTDNELADKFYNSVSIAITDPQTKDDGKTVGKVTVTLPDLAKIYEAHKDEFINDTTGEKLKAALMDNLGEFTTETNFEATVTEENGQWKLADKTELNRLIAEAVDSFIIESLKDVDISITIDDNWEAFGE